MSDHGKMLTYVTPDQKTCGNDIGAFFGRKCQLFKEARIMWRSERCIILLCLPFIHERKI